MSKEFSTVVELTASVDEVHALLTDEAQVIARYEATGFVDVSVTTATPSLVVSTRTDTDALPGALAKFAPVSPPVVQTDTWADAEPDGSRVATWVISTKPLPAELGGTITLKPNGTGTTLTYRAAIKVKVPLVGGKLEPLALGQLTKKLDREWDWLRGASI